MGKIEHLKSGLTTAFIDRNINSNLAYQPEFVSNDYHQGKKVQSTIEQELKNCDEFCISVAFITESGIAPFLMILKELETKNIPGKILTTDYLTFSNPKALKKLAGLKNIDLRMYRTTNSQVGFHTKGYIFEKDEMYRIIIGSSNLTGKAISVNKEWNTKLVGTKDGALIKDVLTEFEQFWNDEKHTEKYETFIDAYEEEYERLKMIEKQKQIALQDEIVDFQKHQLKPNKMQTAFIVNLKKLIDSGEEKALLISATGGTRYNCDKSKEYCKIKGSGGLVLD